MSNLMLDVDQAGELKEAFRRGNWTNSDIKRFSQLKLGELGLIREFLFGRATINVVKHIIDCDADPYLPDKNWKVEEHRKGGQVEWPLKTRFHLSPNQMGKVIEGNKLRKELANELVLNANVLDYLLRHPEFIPDEWKKNEKGNTRYIFFWGTVYRDSDGDLCVRCLYWGDGRWFWDYLWLDFDWGCGNPALVSQVSV